MNGTETELRAWRHPIRAVAFDMDGLLVNTEELYTQVGISILSKRGKRFKQELKNAMTGLPGPKAFQLMIEWEGLSDSVEELEAESATLFAQLLPTQLELLAGVEELLLELDRRGLPRCVATSSSHAFANRVLSSVGVIDRFAFIITADDVAHGKPHPDIYLSAADRMSVKSREMLVLEDSHNGCRAGIASGACTVAVPGPHSMQHDFSGTWLRARSLCDPAIIQLIERERAQPT